MDAPSNLGLRPPVPGAVPGAYKLGWALREQQLVPQLRAREGGTVVPPRYLAEWDGRTLRNREALGRYTRQLAARVAQATLGGDLLLLLGGDCSILLGPMLALRRRGRYGLAFLDGHTDFRHPGNSVSVGSAAGEDLALVTGRGSPAVSDLDGLSPYVRDGDVVAIGARADDEHAEEVRGHGIRVVGSREVRDRGARTIASEVVAGMEAAPLDGFWVHVDADVLDSAIMPAVDSPEPDGLSFDDLAALVNEKEVLPFTRNEGWSERVAGVRTMGLGPRT